MEFFKKLEPASADSAEAMFAQKFKQDVEANKIDISSLHNDEAVKDALARFKRHPKFSNVSLDGIVAELKKIGVIKPLVPEKKIKVKKEPEHIGIKLAEIKLTAVQIDEKMKENLFRLVKETEQAGVFKNDSEFEVIYAKALGLEKKKTSESGEYYYEFARAGLIKGGEEETKEDIRLLEERKLDFKNKEPVDATEKEAFLKAKKIATITERALAYGVSELGWYGEKISIEPASEFDDVKRGVDEVLEIQKADEDSSFMALGIDVTYRGLYSENFKEKLFTLLESIQDGYKTKVKYFKDHQGKMMREFSVPKIILYFDINDVKKIVYMIKNMDDPKIKEEFRNNPKKFDIMNQIIHQCDMLAAFAEDAKNDIFRKYIEIRSSITELSWSNPEIAEMLSRDGNDAVSQHIAKLIQEFKEQ